MSQKELVIRIKLNEDSSSELQALARLLDESDKPGFQKDIIGWRTGQRSLTDRAIALMLDAYRKRAETPLLVGGPISKPPQKVEDNPFG